MFDAKSFLRSLSTGSGVYQMYDDKDQLLYVGKANNLKQRVGSYFNQQSKSLKTLALVERIASIEVTTTATEVEALLLEQNLIKLHHPPYNILLRDDKSYPYIRISKDHPYPRISLFRARDVQQLCCYGPYPSTVAVRESLSFLQKVFKVRPCTDSYFKHRSRPCLEYQIGRCSAPCVGLIDREAYAEDIRHVELFLSGRTQDLTDALSSQMERASEQLAFELAAQIRDQIRALRHVQANQNVANVKGDADIIGVHQMGGEVAVQLLVVRDGNMLGGRCHRPKLPKAGTKGDLRSAEPREAPAAQIDGQTSEVGSQTESLTELLDAFLPQYYGREGLLGGPPKEIILSHPLSNVSLIEQYLAQVLGQRVQIKFGVRGHRKAWLDMALNNAQQQVETRLREGRTIAQKYRSLSEWLSLLQAPAVLHQIQRIECFDISHIQGSETVASCVVFDRDGSRRSDYRRFNIKSAGPSDDYAAMREALSRRFSRLLKERAILPDLLLIDGGKGQLRQAADILEQLELIQIKILGIAKGPTRKAGFETFFMIEFQPVAKQSFVLHQLQTPEPSVMHLLQEIRDEAHRFAISGHRQRRKKRQTQSSLESIPGVGASRRKALLNHFGGLQGIKQASVEDLKRVQGINANLAETIYTHLRGA